MTMAKRGRPPKGTIVESDLAAMLAYWNRALASPKGIKIASAKPQLLMNKLYAARREVGHNAYANFKLTRDETAVWIVPHAQ